MALDASSAVRIGDVLADQYRVQSVLGEGGMGMVYAVVDISSGAPRAMKIVTNTTDAEHIVRFSREGRATMRIDSEHVVRVFDVGAIKNGKLPYMVMERLEGTTLKALVDAKPLDERSVADLMIQACEGLAHAHAIGIVHRDVKPSNLFVLSGGAGSDNQRHLKVLDFGISRIGAASFEDWERTATVTESNALLGSPHYVSPEQLQNASRVDDRADIWSLGVSMYYALSGKFPFSGSSLAELLVSVMSQAPIPIASRCAVSPQMSTILSRCIERSLDRRYRRVSDLAQALAPLASPARRALASRVSTIIATAPRPSQPAPAFAPPVGERTMTVDEPLPPLVNNSGSGSSLGAGEVLPTIEPEPTLSGSELMPSAIVNPSGSTRWELAVDPQPIAGPAGKRPTWIAGVALGAIVAVAIATVGVVVVRTRGGNASSTTSSAVDSTSADPFPPAPPLPPPTPTPTASINPPIASVGEGPSSPSSGAVDPSAPPQLQLVADAPITKIIRPAASRRVALEDGKAFVTVNPFHSDLAIEVELSGGGRARGVARAGGPTTIHLVTTTAGKGVKPASSKPRGSGSNDLHDSPYH